MGLLFNLRDKVDDVRALQDKAIFIEQEIGEYFNYIKDEDKKRILNHYDRISTLMSILTDYMYQADGLLAALTGEMTEEIEKAPESVRALK